MAPKMQMPNMQEIQGEQLDHINGYAIRVGMSEELLDGASARIGSLLGLACNVLIVAQNTVDNIELRDDQRPLGHRRVEVR